VPLALAVAVVAVAALGLLVPWPSLLAAFVAFLGQRVPTSHRESVIVEIAAPADVVWQALTDVSTLVDRYDDITKVELLETDNEGALVWQVQRGDTSVIVYRRQDANKPQSLTVVIDGGNMGIEGRYEYELEALNENQTQLVASETTEVEDFVLRAAFALAGGRGKVFQAQIAEIKMISEAQL